MSQTQLCEQVCVGLLAGPEVPARVRAARRAGVVAYACVQATGWEGQRAEV